MKKIIACFLMFSTILCSVSCGTISHETSSTTSLKESLQENFGDLYEDIESGLLMEGSLNSYWKLKENTITLFGDGAFISTAASFFPWRNVSEHISKVYISKGVTSLGAYAFYGYNKITEVKIEDGEFVVMGIGCFGENPQLKKVELGNTLLEIPDEAFIDCSALEEITIPITVNGIGLDAFENCVSLKYIFYSGSEADWNKIVIEDGNMPLQNAKIVFNEKYKDKGK